jgi:hypothetical protein
MLLFCLSAGYAGAQMPLPSEGVPEANQIFESRMKDTLDCSIQHYQASMDFLFRYDAGFLFQCKARQFEGNSKIVSLIRVTPRHGAPVVMNEAFEFKAVPPEAVRKLGRRIKNVYVEGSGGVALGPGEYSIELALVDTHARTLHRHWKVQAQADKNRTVPVMLPPNTVAPLISGDWDGKLAPDGLRLTVLLHATPIFPGSAKLYAWDRAFLLQTLASLLKQTPCKSVRVIAFNLDQQKEIFHQDDFDVHGFEKLADTLRKSEMSTVSYKALQHKNWAELLVKLTEAEIAAKRTSDAIVFLGPSSRFWDKVPAEMKNFEKTPARFFYFEYYPWVHEFPDAIDYLTRDLHGTVFHIHSADQLRQAIPKMLAQIKPSIAVLPAN